jgi:signal peptidase I
MDRVRNLVPGDVVVFDDGELTVTSCEFGRGFIASKWKTARVMMVTFENGLVIPVHPNEPVKIKC